MSGICASFRIHWLSSLRTPYNDYLFQALHEDPEIDLTVHYRKRFSPGHPWRKSPEKDYKARYYSLRWSVDWTVLLDAVRDKESVFVIAGWDHPTSILLISLLALAKRRFALWTDTPNLGRRRNLVFAFLRSRWLRWGFKRATCVMGTGRPAVEALTLMGAPPDKVVNFPFLVHPIFQALDDKPQQLDNLPVRFISVGRLENAFKGHNLALLALAGASLATEKAFEYVIAGTGPDDMALKRLADELGLGRQVRFVGWLDPAELAQYYRASDVLIHPSPVHDPFPNAVLEAIASGLAILGSDASGSVLDRVEHGINGLIHPAGDISALSSHIAFAQTHPNAMREMGRMARQTASSRSCDQNIRLIKSFLGGRGRERTS